MRLTNSGLLMMTGWLHTAVGVLVLRGELAATWRDGLVASVDAAARPLRAAMLWFFVAGFLMLALAASYRAIEAQDRALPASFGVWLTFLGLSVVVPLPASGGWLLFPQAALVFARAQRRAAPGAVAQAMPEWLTRADHVDVKSVQTQLPVREFTAAMLGYQPAWVTALYAVRAVFVRLLGMRQAGLPKAPSFSAATLPQTPGAKVGFFEVERADANRWCCQVDDVHLWAGLGVIEDTTAAVRQLHVVTVVRYKNASGRVYFNVIRPFHHLVVRAMVRAGLAGSA